MYKVFYGNWDNDKEMCSSFGIPHTSLEGMEILLAYYDNEDYEGYAFVLFKQDGKLYEVNGSHCSCYGLSEQGYDGDSCTQWEPEETSIEALRKRNFRDYNAILQDVLDNLDCKNGEPV